MRLKAMSTCAALFVAMGATTTLADTIVTFDLTEPFGSPFVFVEEYGNPDHAPEVDVSGKLTIDVTSGVITSSAITATHVAAGTPSTFSIIHSVAPDSSGTGIDLTLFDNFNLDEILLDISSRSLVGYAGGEIGGTGSSDTIIYNGAFDLPFTSVSAARLAAEPVSTTPVPGAFALFATGLGVVGIFARRRKRKTREAVAAG